MKKLLYTLLAVSIIFSACEKEDDTPTTIGNNNGNNNVNSSIYTYVPDDNFEKALINLGLDNTLNDTVLTAAIDTLLLLNINDNSINDLTGIEAFTALTELTCGFNQLTSLNVSNNLALTDLDCYYNQLTSLDLSNNTALEILNCSFNSLTSLDVIGANALDTLNCRHNQLTSLDFRTNTALAFLGCSYNAALTSLDLRNGNNTNLLYFSASNNYNLYCIDVDDLAWSTTNWIEIDSQSFFSEDCGVK